MCLVNSDDYMLLISMSRLLIVPMNHVFFFFVINTKHLTPHLSIRRQRQMCIGDKIVEARLGDEVTVKRLRKTQRHIELIPENPDFSTIVVAPDDSSFELEGIAVGLIRNTMLM